MPTDLERELERTTQMRGFRYGLHDFIGHLKGTEALKKANDNSKSNEKGLLDEKTRQLLEIAVLVALKDRVSHIQVHMHAARRAGATPEEILEVVEYISGHTGNVAKITGLESWRATFRPDIPTIDRVVELR